MRSRFDSLKKTHKYFLFHSYLYSYSIITTFLYLGVVFYTILSRPLTESHVRLTSRVSCEFLTSWREMSRGVDRYLKQGLPRCIAVGECVANRFCRDHGWRIFKRNSSRAECRTREVPEPALLILENLPGAREKERERGDRRQFRASLRSPRQVFEKGHPVIWIYGTLLRNPSRPIARSAYFVHRAQRVSFSSRLKYADEVFRRGIIIADSGCQMVFPVSGKR